ncbi:MAG: FAD-dependent oxidoreductase [Aquihabitans sp.]
MDRIVIIGGGPAGASAATFTARAGVDTVVVDADKGMTRRAWVANHLGFPDGVSGPELVDQGRAQAEAAGAAWVDGTAAAIDPSGDGLMVRLEDGQELVAANVVLATGASVALAEAAGIVTADGTEPRIKQIVVVDGEGRTSLPGVWAAGTAAGVSVHTIITAGDGARVAINLLSERKGERHVDHDVLSADGSRPS